MGMNYSPTIFGGYFWVVKFWLLLGLEMIELCFDSTTKNIEKSSGYHRGPRREEEEEVFFVPKKSDSILLLLETQDHRLS